MLSKITFTFPKGYLNLWEIARTRASPGSMITLARISKEMPKAMTMQPDCQIDDGIYIGSSILCGDDKESGVNAEGKQQGSRDLHRLHKGKPAADQCFSQYKEHIKTEGIDTHGGSRNQAQDKRYAGYGRSPKTSSGDKTDPQGADQHTGRKNKIVFYIFVKIHGTIPPRSVEMQKYFLYQKNFV